MSPVASVVPSGRTRTPPALELGGEAEIYRVGRLGRLAGARLFCGLVLGMLNAAVEVAETPLGDRGGMGGNWESVDETCALDIPDSRVSSWQLGTAHVPLTHSAVRRCNAIVNPVHSPVCCRTLLTPISA